MYVSIRKIWMDGLQSITVLTNMFHVWYSCLPLTAFKAFKEIFADVPLDIAEIPDKIPGKKLTNPFGKNILV